MRSATSLPGLRSTVIRLVLVALGVTVPVVARAGPPPVEGLFVTVRAIGTEETERLERVTRAAVEHFRAAAQERPEGQRPTLKIVFDFNPDNHPSSSGSFGACYDLARLIRSLHQDGVTTIAFVHDEVTRHSVLPVLACQEIVMSDGGVDENGRPLAEGKLGDVAADAEEMVYYRQVIQRRPPANRAVAFKLLDKNLKLRRVRREGEQNVFYVDAHQVQEARFGGGWPVAAAALGGAPWDDPVTALVRDALVLRGLRDPFPGVLLNLDGVLVNGWLMDQAPVDPAEPGTARLRAKDAYDFGLCARLARTRQEVKDAYQMPPTSLREDPLLGRTPTAWRFDVQGAFTPAASQSLQRRIRRAIGKGANLIILQLDCSGGDAAEAFSMAQTLRTLKDDRGEQPVTTVAYIPHEAADTAAILALGCSQIVMHRDARFGDFQQIRDSDPQRNEVKLIVPLCALAREQGYPEALIRGMVDRDASLYAAVNRQSPQYEWRLIGQNELNADKWRVEEQIKKPGDRLVLTAPQARAYLLASQVVEGDPGDLAPVYTLYGLKSSQVETSRTDWLDRVWEFLRHPVVSVILVMVGVIGVMLELKLPGVTLPGIVAAVCFVLFFWAHSQLGGQFTWLGILLFVLGLLLLGLEIFVFPGATLPGLAGVLLVIVSLALVTLERKPETTHEWLSFGTTLMTFGLGLVGAVFCALVLAWYLPHIPYVNRLVLKPQSETEEGEEAPGPALSAELAALLGAIGVAATPLRPAGKVQFGDQFVDVVAEGGYVVPGARVQVIEIEANRVVVKEV